MPKSMMDWLGVAGLWLGTGIMALKAGELPLPTGAPAWLTSQWWAIAPFPLVTLSIAWLAIRALRKRQPTFYDEVQSAAPVERPRAQVESSQDGENVIGCSGWLLLPLLAIGGVILVSGTQALIRRFQAEPLPTPPPVLQGPVTTAYLAETLRGQSAVQAEATLAQYLGKPMRATGRIYSKRGERGFRLYIIGLTDPSQVPQVYLKFDGSANDMTGYKRQDHIAANCIIERLDASGVGLSDCKLIEPPKAEEK